MSPLSSPTVSGGNYARCGKPSAIHLPFTSSNRALAGATSRRPCAHGPNNRLLTCTTRSITPLKTSTPAMILLMLHPCHPPTDQPPTDQPPTDQPPTGHPQGVALLYTMLARRRAVKAITSFSPTNWSMHFPCIG